MLTMSQMTTMPTATDTAMPMLTHGEAEFFSIWAGRRALIWRGRPPDGGFSRGRSGSAVGRRSRFLSAVAGAGVGVGVAERARVMGAVDSDLAAGWKPRAVLCSPPSAAPAACACAAAGLGGDD